MESPLASRWWRWTRSWWLLWAVASAGLLAWVGFLYIGLRSRRRAWLLASMAWAVWGAFVAVSATLVPASGGASLLGGLYLGGWIGSIVHSSRARREWLVWLAVQPAWFGPGVGQQQTSVEPHLPVGEEVPGVGQQQTSVEPHLPVGYEVSGIGVVESHALTAAGVVSRVHRLRRSHDGRTVAGKLFTDSLPTSTAVLRRPQNCAEVNDLFTLDHPVIARVYGVVPAFPAEGWLLISEWVEGENLERFAYGEAQLSGARLHAIGSQLIGALGFLEQHGVVHRDIKPANVMISSHGALKIVDFDLSRPDGRHTQIAGTPLYMPPDAPALGSLVDSTVDRYSVGVVLYELAVGEHPYATDIYAGRHPGIRAVPENPAASCSAMPPELCDFLVKAVAAVDAQRFGSAAEMSAHWEAIREPVGAWPGGARPPAAVLTT